MKLWLKFIFALSLLTVLTGCNANLLKPSTVTFTAAEFQTALARKFPVQKNYLGLIDVKISHPQVSMRPEIKHVALQFDADMTSFGNPQVLKSTINMTTALAYNAANKSIVLKDPRLEKIDVAGMSAGHAQALNQVAAVLLNETLQGAPIYTFKPEDLHFLGMNLEPESIEITEQGVVVHIAK